MKTKLGKFLCVALGCMLAVSVGGCRNGAAQPEVSPERTEAGESPAPTARPDVWRGRKIAVLGDSITELNGFQQYLEELTGATVYSYGRSGTTVSGYDPSTFVNRVTTIKEEVDLIIIFGGTNDYHVGIPLGTISDNASTATFYSSLKLLINRFGDKHPGVDLMFITPLQRVFPAQGGTDGLNVNGDTLEQYAAAILEVCADAGLPVLDLYHNSAITVETADEYLYDGIHPNDAGFRVLAEEMAGFLANLQTP